MRRALGAALVVLALAGAARADIVLLADGREIEGTVLEEGDEVVKVRVTMPSGEAVVELARADVRLVIKKGADTSKLAKDADRALALGQRDDAIRILRSLVDARPQDARARRDLAFAELLDEQLERAHDDYQRAVALDSGDIEALVGLGYACGKLADRDGAIDAYRKATTIAPRHVKPWLALAQNLLVRAGRGDREEAISAATRALQAEPRSADAALLAAEARARARGLGATDEHAKALALLDRWLEANPKSDGAARVARRAADLAFGAGDAARAQALVANAIAAAPPAAAVERERLLALEALYGWFAAGRPEPALGLDATAARLDAAAALRRVDLALETVPAEGGLLLLRARLLARQGKLGEAVDAAASAEAALPAGAARDDAGTLKTWLAARSKKEKLDLDEKRARRVAALLALDAAAQETLAAALEKASDLAGARDAFKKAAELVSDAAEKKRLTDEAARVDSLRARREKNKDL